ncbi:MAG: radical SAM family heme chaperone HemW [Prochloraceae cyanobacterium]|nr:radical SAM family heme chaperone HemW [Prochloraceae cyanobacterium]
MSETLGKAKVWKKAKKSGKIDIPRSVYIHIPFCRRRCYYCDFPISVLGDRPNNGTSAWIEEYFKVLCREIEITPVLGKPLETVFFGGGTPSLSTVQQIEHTLKAIDKHFGMVSDAEISMEIDPGTFNLQQLRGYLHTGVNRFSLGVQAFQDELLQVCGRSHSLDDIFVAVDLIRQVNIPNFSLDLISGLPHQTLQQWQHSLETAIKIAPDHISCYDLTIEPVTAFGRKYRSGSKPLPKDEMTATMYRVAGETLTGAGYEHYEISNYAKPGYQCRHNRVYWENRSYYAFGMGAASYVAGQRFTRPRTRKEYYAWVETLIEAGGAIDSPHNTSIDNLLETLMLGLRLAEGVDISAIASMFGEETLNNIWDCLQPYYRQGWVEAIDRDNNSVSIEENENVLQVDRIRLTDPEGFLFSNTVLADLFDRLG